MNEVVVSNHYSGIKRFLPVAVVMLLGLVAALLGHIWVWPFAVGGAVALIIFILAKKSPKEDKKFFHGLSLTFFVSAFMLGAFGVVAVFAGVL